MISDISTARKVLAGMRGMLERAEALPWEADESEIYGAGRTWLGETLNDDPGLTVAHSSLIALAVNGWPALITHCEDVLARHSEDPYARGECLYCESDWAYATNWPCADVLSIFALLSPYESLGEGGKP